MSLFRLLKTWWLFLQGWLHSDKGTWTSDVDEAPLPTLPDPTTCNLTALARGYELELHLLVPPPLGWGHRMAELRSLSILALGGSNSNGELRWPEMLADALKTSFPGIPCFVFNEAVPGYGISHTVGRTYSFEHLESHRWPSIVILESAVNCDIDMSCLQAHEQITNYINHKWSIHGLQPPDYLIVELIKLGEFYLSFDNNKDSYASRLRHVIEFDKSRLKNRYISDFARFYRIPMVSLVDALLPSIIRHFLNCPVNIQWMYCVDLMHIHPIAHQILVKDMLIPFLNEQFQKSIDNNSSLMKINHLDISYLHPDEYRGALKYVNVHSWSSWNRKKTLSNILLDSPGWSFIHLRGHHKGSHVCFGSTTKGSHGKFSIWASSTCQSQSPCLLDLEYVHSWNSSYVGNAQCAVYRGRKSSHVGSVFINGSEYEGNAVHDTVPRKVHLASLDREGNYTISCLNLEDKLACIASVTLSLVNPD